MRHSDRLPQVVALALSLQLAVASVAVGSAGTGSGPSPPGPARGAAAVEPPVAPAPVMDTAAGPVRLSAPALWDGAVEARPLGVDSRGSLDVPDSADSLGWWAAGVRPGGPGAAVVVGHVDLSGQPGVFGRLATAEPGMLVTVSSGGSSVRFRVTRVDRYAKAAFPTDVVYRPSAQAELRLVTCGGRFDPRTGHYEDNVVVEAVREQSA